MYKNNPLVLVSAKVPLSIYKQIKEKAAMYDFNFSSWVRRTWEKENEVV